ncbi:MAG: hypothetical protein QY325_03690 [Flavobacteriales bacterium]|nr:MAG: hypothetical protein QY325_03690 [Flavobacteriales bacterium]
MKTLTTLFCTLLAVLALPSRAWAQEDDLPPIPPERVKEVKAQRTAYLTTKLDLSSEEAQVFWPVYNEFDEARTKLRQDLRQLMRPHRQGGAALTDAEARQILSKGQALRQQELELERDYQDRFVKAIGAVKVVDLHKAERDFNREVLRRLRDRMEERREGRPAPPGRR